ncbi:MAG: putative two component transcriptional regulator, winged helix family [Paenibacillus sp.]|jgi:tetratricopeptide (TPR) repeat protein|nr:putative two component transcriptional regulator, winged helix family [Paenibacillus sp.]
MSTDLTKDQELYQKLLLEEEHWEQAFDDPQFDQHESGHWDRGVEIYEELNRINPSEHRFQSMLVHCLLELGRDLKMRGSHMRKARDIFQQVTRMDREHSLANYRLGFLYYYDEMWDSAARSFERALRRKALLSEHRINEEQIVKALCYQAWAYQKLSQQTMERIQRKWRDLANTPLGDTLRSLITETEDQIYSEEPFKPYTVITNNRKEQIGKEQLLQLLEAGTEGTAVTLNYVEAPRQYIVQTLPKRKVFITERSADLLRYLLESPASRSKEDIFSKMFKIPMPPNSTWVKTNISRLRTELAACFSEPMDQIILTTKEGYFWNHQMHPAYRIVYREDDIYRADFDLN